jgi:hypothetical protein
MVNGEEDRIERRVERAVFETDRQVVVGDVTLPPAGYQSRFSDSLNRGDLEFVPLTNCEITSLIDGRVSERAFVVLNKRHVRLSYPYPRQPAGPGMVPPGSAYDQPLS